MASISKFLREAIFGICFVYVLALSGDIIKNTLVVSIPTSPPINETEQKPPKLNLPAKFSGTVTRVTDGDTIDIRVNKTSTTVRLSGIDAPEIDQSFGIESKIRLEQLVNSKEVLVDASKYDRFGRIIAKVYIRDLDIGLSMISDGFAWHFKKYANEQSTVDRKQYEIAEKTARNKKFGLWADPIAPWKFRDRN